MSINDSVKITVLMVCYNQEKLVGKTLDSILSQRDYGLCEIVVGDDCSSDGTPKVLLDYQKRYPEIVRPILNERNMGIYGNLMNVTNNRGKADLYIDAAGDDPLCDGFFEAVQKLVAKENINTSEAVGIYSDWKRVSPEGKETIRRNSLVKENYNLWSLYIRGKISGRSLLVSNKVIEAFDKIVLDQGLGLAETMHDSQFHLNIKKAYYLPMITSIYYSGIGVSTKLRNKNWAVTQSRIKMSYLMEHYANDNKDKNYIRYCLKKCDFYEKPTIGCFISMFYYYEKGQLPGCRNSMKYTFKLFGSMFQQLFTKK